MKRPREQDENESNNKKVKSQRGVKRVLEDASHTSKGCIGKEDNSTQESGQLGLIETVSLQNFMCHDNLRFDFGPHINFIIGRNGSGKSAILSGIILALGGKSTTTKRGRNIKSFIKTGKQSATISVVLRNRGINAYKPEEYGKKINVERVLNADGTSQYKIKSEAGRIISTSKEELNIILNIMDIQVENPTVILTQETSRDFMDLKQPKRLFELFYGGSGLQKIEEEYHKAQQKRIDAEEDLKNKKELLPEIEKQVKDLKTILDSMQKKIEYSNELLWAGVIQREKHTEDAKRIYEKEKIKLSELENKLHDNETCFLEVKETLKKCEKEKTEKKNLVGQLTENLDKLREQKESLLKSIREHQGALELLRRKIESADCEIAVVEKTIYDVQNKNKTDEKGAREEEIKELKKQLEHLAENTKKFEDRKEECHRELQNLRNQLDTTNAEKRALLNDNEKIKIRIEEMKQGMNKHIHVFGLEMHKILTLIQQALKAGEFKKPPVGPIGMHIEVKELKWCFAVEECLKKNLLRSFCCDNQADSIKLRAIFDKCYGREARLPSIIVSPYLNTVHNVENYKVRSGYPTVLDMLKIKDPRIANCLIDQKHIENIILIEHNTEAVQFMINNPPRNCHCAFTLTGDQLYANPYRYYSCRSKRDMSLLKSVDKSDISTKEKELGNIKREIQQKDNEIRTMEERDMTVTNEFNVLNGDIKRNRTALRSVDVKIKDLSTEESPTNINSLQADLEGAKERKMKMELESQEHNRKLSLKEKELRTLDLQAKQIELEQKRKEHRQIIEDIYNYQKKKENLSTEKKRLEAEFKEVKSSVDKYFNDYTDKCKLTEKIRAKAESTCPRIDTDRSPDRVMKHIQELEQAMNRMANCDTETLTRRCYEKCELLKQKQKELESLEMRIKKIEDMLNIRLRNFKNICKNAALRLDIFFINLLNKNKFVGRLVINFKDQTLQINCRPLKVTSKSAEAKGLNHLSGGERSYTTISFLLSLWEHINMPFRILDEYDVFMDSDNRHISINLLVNYARHNRNVQYIFLSPLQLPQLENTNDIEIREMPAPREPTKGTARKMTKSSSALKKKC